MLVINNILFFGGVFLIVAPIIFVIVMVIYNGRVNKRIKTLQREINEKNVRKFINTAKFGPFAKHDRRWNMLNDMFRSVNKSKKVTYDTKKSLYEVLIKRGCKKENLNFKLK